MKRTFDKHLIYEFSDEEIVIELCKKLKTVRLSCCMSQQEFADKCGMAIITVKRIESLTVKELNFGTLLKMMRVAGILENVVDLVPDVPESPFLINKRTGARIKRFNSKRKAI